MNLNLHFILRTSHFVLQRAVHFLLRASYLPVRQAGLLLQNQPFFNIKPTGLRTVLGLSLAYDITKAYGGEITIRSTPDEGSSTQALAQAGSEFIITLPVNF